MSASRSSIRRSLLPVVLATGLLAMSTSAPAPASRLDQTEPAPAATTREADDAGQVEATPDPVQPEVSWTMAVAPSAPPEPGSSDQTAPGTTAPPSGDLDGWKHAFTEDFTTPAPLGTFDSVYSRWVTYQGPDTSRRGTYSTGSVLSVADGVLDWHVHTADGQHKVAAIMPRAPGSTYGRYSVRFRADEIPGYKMVVILWPDSDDWGEGEIDFPEVGELVKGDPMCAFLHGPGDYANSAAQCTQTSAAGTGWHTATIVWEPGRLTYVLDDQVIGTHTAKIPSTPFHLVLQVESNLGGRPIPNTSSGHIQVDWVTIHTVR